LKNIAGVKDATVQPRCASRRQRHATWGTDFNQLTGDDMHRARLSWRHGGHGCISVVVQCGAASQCADLMSARLLASGDFKCRCAEDARPADAAA
jgi:dihydrodipicolinate synthase/N-acetylneuraminate lyase